MRELTQIEIKHSAGGLNLSDDKGLFVGTMTGAGTGLFLYLGPNIHACAGLTGFVSHLFLPAAIGAFIGATIDWIYA